MLSVLGTLVFYFPKAKFINLPSRNSHREREIGKKEINRMVYRKGSEEEVKTRYIEKVFLLKQATGDLVNWVKDNSIKI